MRLLKKIIIVPILILFFFVLGRNLVPSSFAPASNTSAPSRGPAGASPNGVYSIVGTSSDLGSYSGVAWVYNGIVQRKVRYDQYLYNDNKVESIWSGTVNADSFEFTLSLSNALTAFEGFAPDATAFENPIKIYLPLEDISTEFNFSNETEGNLHETWRFQSTASSAPLWKDLRAAVVGLGDTSSIIKSLLNWSGIYQVINLYRQSPELVPYTSKAAFREAKQYYIQDKTDADFYLSNPNVLRITNKTVNPLSLAEATMRRNAYGHSLAWKEQYLRSQTINNNLNSAGLLELAIVDNNGVKIGRTHEGDSALWTGMLGWSEFVRYQVTGDLSALANYKKILNGILTLIEITNDPKQFARTLIISPQSENLGDQWVQGLGQYSHLKWLKGGNNDMLKGVFITLAIAHQALRPNDFALIQRVKKVTKSLKLLPPASKDFNLGMAQGLNLLWNNDLTAMNDFYGQLNNLKSDLAQLTRIEPGFHFGGIADWSGIHLTMASDLGLLLVSKELQKTLTDAAYKNKAIQAQKTAEFRLVEMYKTYANAHRDFLTLMVHNTNPKAQVDINFRSLSREALWTLKEVPAPRSMGNGTVDLRMQPKWSASAWPALPWKALDGIGKVKRNFDMDQLTQGAYSYPIFETHAWMPVYLWVRNPFFFTFNSNSSIQMFSPDYLLMYWTSRASGLITANE